ncbi:phage holin, lambda family [Photorhabdus laumondii subsp. laumondii]|uniref:Photorhabdus luminescens subsp. laumondii TTO1 complete genome segment 13/17 n=3 Tax=Photorhabdus laumondii TaxID=2218628 RepID=Q7N0Y0_PHOLL|nr:MULTISPECIES: phage holin, lambda family [Photorhabdus]MCE1736449.1 phage holin, lambda family [Enterobacter hormaechei]AWK43370.1 holin [Photorhabdus laumondii subsp. laumondii]AXG44041.1 phage holin, lambda family [Photorhabdus laumondii subsp. laumondii]AXG48674.1 phage holin, lambda family [Photorhabdus laumondii subsp. laumondii]KTL63304.1 holin [Photorhabdus laumondii subsp. laumondii]
MKYMDKQPDIWMQLWLWLLSVKEQGIGAALAAAMAYLRGRYNGGKFWTTIMDSIMCAMIAWFIRDALNFFGMSTDLAYISSVIIGYLGTDYFGQILRKVVNNKTGNKQ